MKERIDLAYKKPSKLKNITLTLLIWANIYLLASFIPAQGIGLMAILIVGVTFAIILPLKVLDIKKNETLRKLEIRNIIELIVNEARNGDYSNLNYFLKHPDASEHVMEITQSVCRHNYGQWLDKTKLIYPKVWGEDFWEKSAEFFKNHPYDDIDNHIAISTYLSYVKKDVMEKVVAQYD